MWGWMQMRRDAGDETSGDGLESEEDNLLNELIGFSHQSSTPPPSVPLIQFFAEGSL